MPDEKPHLSREAFDTRIQLSRGRDEFHLAIPPLRPDVQTLAPLGFSAICLAFIAFWTRGALRSGGFFAALSIPFWAAGVAILVRAVKPLLQTTRLVLGRESGTLQTTPMGRTRTLRTSELRARIGGYVRYRHEGLGVDRKNAKALLLEQGTQTFSLLNGYSKQEQLWIESELQSWLRASNPTSNLSGLPPRR